MVRTKNQESSRCWDWVWIEALSYWMTLRTVSWPPCASAIQQYHWGKGGTSLNTRCTAQAFQAKLQNSKISMLIRKHFLNDSPVPFDFFLKGWEWPGSQWGTRTISVALAGWAPLYLQNIRAGLPKIPTALKKKNNASVGKTESTRRNTGVPDEHSCTQAAAEVSMVYRPDCCQAEHVWLGRKGKAAKRSTVHISGRQASLTDVFLRLTLFCTGL